MDVHVIHTEIIKISRWEDDRISKQSMCRECFFKDPDYEYSKYILSRTHDIYKLGTPPQNNRFCKLCHTKMYEQCAAADCKLCYCEDDWLAHVYVDHPLRRLKRRATKSSTTIAEKRLCKRKLEF
jgi:hypothetical protein